MKLTTTLGVALRALLRNPTRALLTMLGIVIGIAAVITMMEIGNGSAQSIRSSIESMGATSIMVMPGASRHGGISMGTGSVMSLTPGDYEEIRDRCPHVAAAAPVISTRGQVIYGNRNWTPNSMVGSSPSYFDVRSWYPEEGEIFTEQQMQRSATVCLVGATIVRELFNGRSPLGEELRIKDVNFKVIGVLPAKGSNMMGFDQDDIIVAPWTTVRQRLAGSRSSSTASATSDITTNSTYPGSVDLYPESSGTNQTNYRLSPRFVYVDQIMVEVTDPENSEAAVEEINEILRRRHKIPDDQPDDYHIRNAAEMMKMLTTTSSLMTNLLLGVALISLVVGGVGIMNIMLVSVTERTREIGLRMAVGARSRDILKQFLIESIVLCLSGGLIGILLGHGAALLVALQLKWPVASSPGAVVAAVVVSALVGIVFGFYPAWKASRLDPIDALRYE